MSRYKVLMAAMLALAPWQAQAGLIECSLQIAVA
jgi:hypothetical protein